MYVIFSKAIAAAERNASRFRRCRERAVGLDGLSLGVVGRPRASEPGYDYSAAMKAKGGSWTFDELNEFLAGPRNYIPGTKMTFAGLSSENQRADIIAYLRTLSDNPLRLPTAPNTTAAPAGSKPNEQAPAQKKGS
jgi:cytochrome c